MVFAKSNFGSSISSSFLQNKQERGEMECLVSKKASFMQKYVFFHLVQADINFLLIQTFYLKKIRVIRVLTAFNVLALNFFVICLKICFSKTWDAKTDFFSLHLSDKQCPDCLSDHGIEFFGCTLLLRRSKKWAYKKKEWGGTESREKRSQENARKEGREGWKMLHPRSVV